MAKKTSSDRYTELSRMLNDRRRELELGVQAYKANQRSQARDQYSDKVDESCVDVQEDIDRVLIEMKSETLIKIKDALNRLASGDYGNCFECGEEIAEKRLRALPFAVRCKTCEEAREYSQRMTIQQRQLRGSLPLLDDDR